MYKVKFDTGEIVDFQNQPTDADIEEVVKNLGIKPKSASIPETLPQTKKPETGFLEKLGKFEKDIATGVGKGATSTAVGLGQLALKGANLLPLPEKIKNLFSQSIQTGEDIKSVQLKPENLGQTIGKTAEQIGEYFIPLGEAKLAAKATSLIPQSTKIFKGGTLLSNAFNLARELVPKSLVEGASFAGRTAAQTGGNLEETKKAGLIGTATPPILKGIGAATVPIGKTISAVIGQMIGKEPEHIIRAFKNPQVVAKKISQQTTPLKVREEAINALSTFKKGFQKEFTNSLDDLQKFNRDMGGLVEKNIFKEGRRDEILNSLYSTLRNLKISASKNGNLNFDKLNSSIVRVSEQKNIQAVVNTIKKQTDFSPKGVQAVASRIGALSKFVEGSKTVSSKAITDIHNSYANFIEKTYSGLGEIRKNYSVKTQIYKGIDNVLKSVKNGKVNPTTATTVAKKLSRLFAEDNEAYVQALQSLEKETGVDLLNSLVASEFKDILPRKLGSVLAQAGILTTGFIYNPLLLLALPLFSPKLEGKIITGAGKVAPIVEKTVKSIPKTLPALLRGNQSQP